MHDKLFYIYIYTHTYLFIYIQIKKNHFYESQNTKRMRLVYLFCDMTKNTRESDFALNLHLYDLNL